MTRPFDVLGLGIVAVDELLYVDHYPPADSKTEVQQRDRQCGGLTATALVAASRLGSSCAYAGVFGEDEPSLFAHSRLEQEGIDLSHAPCQAGASVTQSFIVVDQKTGSRAILFDRSGVVDVEGQAPPADLIQQARVLLVDHFRIPAMIRVARIARSAKVAVVADLEDDTAPRFAELLEEIDHPILPLALAEKLTQTSDPAAATRALWNEDRTAVVVTCGQDGCWYAAADTGGDPRHHPAFAVDAIDTTGCGDVFHGAYAAALAQGLDLPERIRFAAAAAALKATRRGGQAGIPTRSALDAFLQEHA